jgi:hypothetical protein
MNESDERTCHKCKLPVVGTALGPIAAAIEASGCCSNCGAALDGSDRKMPMREMFEFKRG